MKNINIGPVLTRLRRDHDRTLTELSEDLNGAISISTLSRMEKTDSALTPGNLKTLADYYQITVADIMREAEGSNSADPDIIGAIKVPVINWVQAGQWTESPENMHPSACDEWVIAPRGSSKNTYALRIKGDSMQAPSGLSFPEGMIIIVDPDREPHDKSFVVARFVGSDECTFKQLVFDGPSKYLKPLNPGYKPIQINGETVICGIVTRLIWDAGDSRYPY